MNVKHLYLDTGKINPAAFQKRVIVWGAGKDGRKLLDSISGKARDMIVCFWDTNANVNHANIDGIPIYPVENWVFEDYNLVLAFSRWNEVQDYLDTQEFNRGEVFADYPFLSDSVCKCIACGGDCYEGKAHFAPFIQAREFGGNNPDTRLIMCRECGLVYSKYRPNDSEMERLYSGYRDMEYFKSRHYYEPQYTEEINNMSLSPQSINSRRQGIIEFIKRKLDINDIHSVLDYGGDEGQMIPLEFSHASKTVFEVSGNSVQSGIRLISDFTELMKHTYDFIMCCHLLEHVSDPLHIVCNMFNVLTPEGSLYIEVPNENAYQRYSDYEFHEHINFFGIDTLKIIGSRCGLKCIDFEESNVIKMLFEKNNLM